MRFKQNINLSAFFEQVRKSNGDVWFFTNQKDQLNLKSQLSQYVFAAAFFDSEFRLSGNIICENPADEKLLQDFTE